MLNFDGRDEMKNASLFCVVLVLVVAGWSGMALADKSAATIEGPASAAKGAEITVKITVTHSANSATHYTEWVKVTANGKEIGRWNFTSSQRPEAATFTKEVKVTIVETTEIKAEANCNVHGGKGPSTLKISVK
jgi:desulfoferrodoxin (superoxide reductase-like protein)